MLAVAESKIASRPIRVEYERTGTAVRVAVAVPFGWIADCKLEVFAFLKFVKVMGCPIRTPKLVADKVLLLES